MVDADGDGLLSSTETPVPSASGSGTGDGNGDGVPDANQANVVSLPGADGSTFLTLVGAEGQPLTSVTPAQPPADFPAESQAPFSGLAFTVNGLTAGGTATVELFLPFNPAVNGLLKLNRNTGRYDNIATSVSQVGTVKTVVSFDLVDGGPYDADGVVNGSIQDPAFPAVVPSVTIGTVASSGGALGWWLTLPLLLLSRLRRKVKSVGKGLPTYGAD